MAETVAKPQALWIDLLPALARLDHLLVGALAFAEAVYGPEADQSSMGRLAAYYAAQSHRPLGMEHLLQATQREYQKTRSYLERCRLDIRKTVPFTPQVERNQSKAMGHR